MHSGQTATFSLRGCKWKSQIKYVCRGTPYKVGWTYLYNDTSPMIVVAYHKGNPPKRLHNPVGKWCMPQGDWYECKKLYHPRTIAVYISI